MKTFPNNVKENLDKQTVSDRLFGHRFHSDQTLYEYLIEFLLIYISPKYVDVDQTYGEMRFHNKNEDLKYFAEPKMGLKRFIFYDSSKKDKSIKLDEDAYYLLVNELKKQMDDDEKADKAILALQDLLRGYAVVLKKRTWCAQQTLPICPELIFTEAMPNLSNRQNVKDYNSIEIDNSFQFKQRNFLAKGGEVYYLHLLQALYNDESDERKDKLNELLKNVLTNQSGNISKISRIIQSTWEDTILVDRKEKVKLYEDYDLSYIPADAYLKCGSLAVDEMINYLSSDFQQIKKIEIMAKGIMFQIMRMMYCAVSDNLGIKPRPWIVDMTNNSSTTIKKISNNSFRGIEDDFKQAINSAANDMFDDKDILKAIKKGQKDSLDIFRSKGKELRCIIPVSGAFERFTLSEDILRFLVTSLISPNEKITFDMFLERLYKHYNIVIGANQYEKSMNKSNVDDHSIKNCLYENEINFQKFLKSTGFLKELSDSTSLVFNPYNSIE